MIYECVFTQASWTRVQWTGNNLDEVTAFATRRGSTVGNVGPLLAVTATDGEVLVMELNWWLTDVKGVLIVMTDRATSAMVGTSRPVDWPT